MKHSKIQLFLAAATLAIIYYHENNTADKFNITQFIEKAIIQQNNDKKETSAVLYKFAELFLKYADEKPIAKDCLLAAYDHLTNDEKILYAKKHFSPVVFIESIKFLKNTGAKTSINLSNKNKLDKRVIENLFDNNISNEDKQTIRKYLKNLYNNIGNSKSSEWLDFFSHRIKDHQSFTDLGNYLDPKILDELNIGRVALTLSITDGSPEDILVYTTTTYNHLTNTDQICQNLWVPSKAH